VLHNNDPVKAEAVSVEVPSSYQQRFTAGLQEWFLALHMPETAKLVHPFTV